MSVRDILHESFESIQFQSSGFFYSLAEAFRVLRQDPTITRIRRDPGNGKYVRELESGAGKLDEISAIVKKYTNIDARVKIDPSLNPNAYVYPPEVDKNHPLISEWTREYLSYGSGIKAINAARKPLESRIDLQGSKVYGHYANIPITMAVTLGLVLDDKITEDELAAILLHEVGHVFSYFEMIGYTYKTCSILATTTNAFFSSTTISEKRVVLDTFNKGKTYNPLNVDEVSKIKDKTVFETIVLKNMMEERASDMNASTYNKRTFEQLADDFASRQGAGRALATGLYKINKQYFSSNSSTLACIFGWMMELIGLATIVILMVSPIGAGAALIKPILGLVLVIIFFGADPNQKIYDDLSDRIANIRRQSVEVIKSKYTSDISKMEAENTIKALTELENRTNNAPGIVQAIWSFLIPSRVTDRRDIEEYKRLEELAANSLYVTAYRLRNAEV